MNSKAFTNIEMNVLSTNSNSSSIQDLSCLPFHNSHNVPVTLHVNNSRQTSETIYKIAHNDCFNNYDRSHLSEIDPDNNYINDKMLPDTQYFDETSF